MPELPEVETVRQGLNQVTLNQKIQGGDVLLTRTIAYPFSVDEFLTALKHTTITGWHRRGKYLLAELSKSDTGNQEEFRTQNSEGNSQVPKFTPQKTSHNPQSTIQNRLTLVG